MPGLAGDGISTVGTFEGFKTDRREQFTQDGAVCLDVIDDQDPLGWALVTDDTEGRSFFGFEGRSR